MALFVSSDLAFASVAAAMVLFAPSVLAQAAPDDRVPDPTSVASSAPSAPTAPVATPPVASSAPATPPVAPHRDRDPAAVEAHVRELIQRARTSKLSENTQWRRLLHYDRRLLGGQKSRADDAAFFSTPNGRTDPAGELEGTIRAAFADEGPADKHALCRFPARTRWLAQQLSFDSSLLPAAQCPAFDAYFKRVGGKSLTLVFSAYYLNNPASAFGHTLLRVNRQTTAGKGKRRELLDYGIGYAAAKISDNALVYAMSGMFGLGPGEFTKVPYYYKVREYNDYESRDLWEYDLDLSPDAVSLVVAHFWELGGARFNYWYLDENCSFYLLAAIEAAEPRLDLTSQLKNVVIPADTVKALFAVPGLVRATRFRPSLRTTLTRRLEALGSDEVDLVIALSDDPATPLPKMSDETKVQILDAAIDLVDVRFTKELIDNDGKDSPAARKKQALLALRSEILIPSPPVDTAPRRQDQVELSHGSGRAAASIGAFGNGRGFYQLEYRLAAHDFADAPAGYPANAELEFLPTRFRFDARTAAPRLEDVWIFRGRSTSPMNQFSRPLSWRVAGGIQTIREKACRECRVGTFVVGGGGAIGFGKGRVTLFALGDVRADFGSNVEQWKIPARAGVGPSGGARVRVTDQATWVTTGGLVVYPLQEPALTWTAESTVRWAYSQNLAAGATGKLQPKGQEAFLSTFVYF
jgi:hypothetical protein